MLEIESMIDAIDKRRKKVALSKEERAQLETNLGMLNGELGALQEADDTDELTTKAPRKGALRL